MLKKLGKIQNPKQVLSRELTEHASSFIHFEFEHVTQYLEDTNSLRLGVLWCHETSAKNNKLSVKISIFNCSTLSFEQSIHNDRVQYESWVSEHNLPTLDVDKIWPLEQLRIAKPWGAELWYTGIEARGVCTSNNMALPWLLDCIPPQFSASASNQPPLLLKILDPLADPELGNLYFELHDKKIEVYIVTSVDRSVWPDGIGQIRYGFNQSLRESFTDDAQFKSAYLLAVQEYQKCRNEIDKIIEDAHFVTNTDEMNSAETSKTTSLIPVALVEQETELRSNMDRFTHLREIKVGDVIRVEPFFPHSLQHGVRVIEFQTASYERYILSFGQKVLTQDHWDTAEAIEYAVLDLPQQTEMIIENCPEGATLEVIADFSAFTAKRLTLKPKSTFTLPDFKDYRIIIGVSGVASLGDQLIEPEEGFLIPLDPSERTLKAKTSTVVVIIAEPK